MYDASAEHIRMQGNTASSTSNGIVRIHNLDSAMDTSDVTLRIIK
jgi:hypothetical protein